jgi:Methyltransferase domain
MKERLKALAGDGGRRRLERMGRIRFDRKLRNLRAEGVGFRRAPLAYASYLLLDPELHSYSFELANRDGLAAFAVRALGITPAQARGYLDETDADPELNERLTRRVRPRFDYKRRLPLGNRLLWHVVARAVKPGVAVETGIHDGLGSLVLLRALERNAAEGHDGVLHSFDLDPDAGWLVPAHLRGRWEQVTGLLEETLEPALSDGGVDLLVHDSDHTPELQRFEFTLALAHTRSEQLWVVDASGLLLPVLRDLCGERGGDHHYFRERPRRHFYATVGTSVARLPAGPE